jgi:DNA-binding GntR family transcriptional regulator
MRDRVRDAIVNRILDGEYGSGTRLKELALAREFNVSQAPVREALRELEALGLLESERYRGTRVRGIDLSELREAYELRGVLEEASAQRAIPCRPADLDELDADIALMRRADRAGDHDAHIRAALHFHRLIVEMSGNRMFLHAWEQMAWEVRARIAIRRLGMGGPYTELRRIVVDALRAGDARRAGQLMREIAAQVQSRVKELESAAAG